MAGASSRWGRRPPAAEIIVLSAVGLLSLAMIWVAVGPFTTRCGVGHETRAKDNVRHLLLMMIDRRTSKVAGGWPPYDGKNFVLSLVATNQIDVRNEQNLEILFSPGDVQYRLEATDPARYREVTKAALAAGADFHELTSYAGRRNADPRYHVTEAEEKRGTMLICDDDDGPLHHPDGLVVGYSSGAVRFLAWDEIDVAPPRADAPEPFLGEAASHDGLRALASW